MSLLYEIFSKALDFEKKTLALDVISFTINTNTRKSGTGFTIRRIS